MEPPLLKKLAVLSSTLERKENKMGRFTQKFWSAALCLALLFGVSLLQPAHAQSTITFTAGEAIAQGVRVKISGSGILTAGATDEDVGTTLAAADSGAPVAVNLTADGEIGVYTASAAITVGADVYPSASGKVSSTVSGKRIGKALKAASTNGDLIRVLRMSTSVDRVFISVPIAAASVDTWAFVADRPYTVIAVKETHSVAGSDGGTVTLDVRKITDVSAPGASAGSTVKELLSAALNLKSTANTPVTGTLSATAEDLDLAAGDKIGFNFAGTLTALAGGSVQIELKMK